MVIDHEIWMYPIFRGTHVRFLFKSSQLFAWLTDLWKQDETHESWNGVVYCYKGENICGPQQGSKGLIHSERKYQCWLYKQVFYSIFCWWYHGYPMLLQKDMSSSALAKPLALALSFALAFSLALRGRGIIIFILTLTAQAQFHEEDMLSQISAISSLLTLWSHPIHVKHLPKKRIIIQKWFCTLWLTEISNFTGQQ